MIASGLALSLALSAPAGPSFDVLPGCPGRNRLDVTPALVSASARGDLSDLRLRDGQGREVPYLLVPPSDPAPRWVRAPVVRPIPVRNKKESGAELDLGATSDVAGLRLDVPARASFVRSLRVEGSVDGARWTTLVAEGAIYALEREGCAPPACGPWLTNLEVRFPLATVRRLRVVFDDRRAPPLPPMRGAEALLAGPEADESGPSVPLAVSRRDAEPGVSRFSILLPGPHLPVRAVRLDVDARHLFRPARLLESRLEGGRLVPHELGRGQLVRTERDGVTVAALRIEIARPEEQELELVVEDGDGAPLALRGAEAELAPLPWVFFESAECAKLAATAADPELRAPRYDLEAVRPELVRVRAAGPRSSTLLLAARLEASPAGPQRPPPPPAPVAAGDAALPGAPLDAGAFRIARTVAAAEPGLAAVRLDAAVLAESPELADVRLAEADGRQLPYLAESRPEPLTVPLALSAPLPGTPAARPGATVRALPLAFGAAPASRLVLETSARVFTRTVRVYVEGADDPRASPAPMAEAAWSHADPARAAPALTIPLPAVRGERLLVALDDGDNAPLPLVSAALLLPAWRLRFFHPGPQLRLLHGASGLSAPRYDLALLAPRLRAAPVREVALGPAPSARRRLPGARTVFWIVLGSAVVGLLALVGRLVGKGSPPAAP